MTDLGRERMSAIKDLVTFARPLEEISATLSKFDWDFSGSGVLLERKHIANVLHRYLDGEVSATKVEVWANLIESREDICAESDFEDCVGGVIYDLANPLLTHALDKELAASLLQRMGMPD